MSVDTVQRALLMPGQRNASTMPAHGRDAAAVVSTLGGERTALVVGDDPELAVALRDRLDRAYVTVREVRTSEALVAVRARLWIAPRWRDDPLVRVFLSPGEESIRLG
jgi:hypothetical protein